MSHSFNNIEHLIDRLHFTDDIIVVIDSTSIDMNSGEMKVIKLKKMMRERHLDIA